MSRKRLYSSFQQNENVFRALPDLPLVKTLPAGNYTFFVDPDSGIGFFEAMDMLSDGIIDLPSNEYKLATTQIDKFLTPETKTNYEKYKFLYKRSILLEGLPGTGKSVIINRVAKTVVEKGGVVIFNPNPSQLKLALTYLKDINPNQTVMVIFEELDQLMRDYEDDLLHILDGELQVENIIYMATTNYIDEIPKRILRPGRFSLVINVGFPDTSARRKFLETKLTSEEDRAKFHLDKIVEMSEGLSIDELKEIVLSLTCLDGNLEETVGRIKETRDINNEEEEDANPYLAANKKYKAEQEFAKKFKRLFGE